MATFTREDSDRLTQVHPGTPTGALFRRHWIPVLLSEQLPEPHCDPVPVDALGEELVAFRGADGVVGLLDRYCPHRRASLVLARNEDCAIRCVYHGWKISSDGHVLETPPEEPNSKRAQTAKVKSYPTKEFGGLVWAYMGDGDAPNPPAWPFREVPDAHVKCYKIRQPNNWVRSLDAEMDAGHAGYLHYTEEEWQSQKNTEYDGYKYLFDPRPSTWVRELPWGLENIFRYRLEDPSQSAFWVRSFVAPCFGLSGQPQGARGRFVAYVPANEFTTDIYYVFWRIDEPLSPEDMAALESSLKLGSGDPDRQYVSRYFEDGVGYVQDRESMRSGKSYSGFEGVVVQDLAVQYSMAPRIDMENEQLGSEDEIVIKVRRNILQHSEAVERGETLPEIDFSRVQYRWVVAPTETPMRDISAHPEWSTVPEEGDPSWVPAETAWKSIM